MAIKQYNFKKDFREECTQGGWSKRFMESCAINFLENNMNEKYNKGLELLNKLHGGHTGEAIINNFKTISPKMAETTIELVFGDILQRKELDIKTRELAIIASVVTLGHSLPQVRAHVEAAINAGASKIEISEVILQTAYFAGFPAAANAFIAVKDLLE